MPLTRIATGLVFRDDFDRPDGPLGADYTVDAGTFVIEGGQARSSQNPALARVTSMAARGDQVVQARLTHPSSNRQAPRLMARAVSSGTYYAATLERSGTSGWIRLYRHLNDARSQIGAATGNNWEYDAAVTIKLGTANGRVQLWSDGVQRADTSDSLGSGTLGTAGFGGWLSEGRSLYDDLVVCAANTITVSGLAPGAQVQVKNSGGAVVAGPTPASGGAATVDLGGTVFPFARVEVLDGSGALVESWDGEGWGADAYEIAAQPGPDTEDVVAITQHGARIIPAVPGAGIVARRYQITPAWDEGFTAPIVSTDWLPDALAYYDASGLQAGVRYIARARDQLADGTPSDWGAPSAVFETLPTAGADHGPHLRRLGIGLLYEDDYARADGAETLSALTRTAGWTIQDARLVNTTTSGEEYARAYNTRGRQAVVVEGHLRRNGPAGRQTWVFARRDLATGAHYRAGLTESGGARAVSLIRRSAAGADQVVASAPFEWADGIAYRVTLEVAAGTVEVQRVWIDGVRLIEASDASLAGVAGESGYMVSGTGGPASFGPLTICSGNLVSITSLPEGAEVRWGGLASAENGGRALFYLDGQPLRQAGAFEVWGRQVTWPHDTELRLLARLAPEFAWYGGDELVYSIERPDLPLRIWIGFGSGLEVGTTPPGWDTFWKSGSGASFTIAAPTGSDEPPPPGYGDLVARYQYREQYSVSSSVQMSHLQLPDGRLIELRPYNVSVAALVHPRREGRSVGVIVRANGNADTGTGDGMFGRTTGNGPRRLDNFRYEGGAYVDEASYPSIGGSAPGAIGWWWTQYTALGRGFFEARAWAYGTPMESQQRYVRRTDKRVSAPDLPDTYEGRIGIMAVLEYGGSTGYVDYAGIGIGLDGHPPPYGPLVLAAPAITVEVDRCTGIGVLTLSEVVDPEGNPVSYAVERQTGSGEWEPVPLLDPYALTHPIELPHGTYSYRAQAWAGGTASVWGASSGPVLVEDCGELLPDEELIIFGDDDTTPILTCSALYPHTERPYLLLEGEQLDESRVELAEGRSDIGQRNVRVLDKRTDPADQDSGWVTALLADLGGESALNGRRALRRRWVESEGRFRVLLDGVVTGITLDPDHVTYTFALQDARSRERRLRAFEAGGSSTVLPPGVLNGFGAHTVDGATQWLIEPAVPLKGTMSSTAPFIVFAPPYNGGAVPAELVETDAVKKAYRKVVVDLGEDEDGIGYVQISYPDVEIWWRVQGEADWLVRPMHGIASNVAYLTAPAKYLGRDVRGIHALYLPSDGTGMYPPGGTPLEVLVLYRGRPSEAYPLHLEGLTAGELLRNLYRGDYAAPAYDLDGDPLPPLTVRYDEAALLAIDAPVRLRLTEPVDDVRRWAEQHIYRPTGYAPALDELGRVSPVRVDVPAPGAELPVIDGSIVDPSGATWGHAGDPINVVRLTYPLVYRPAEVIGDAAGDGLQTTDVVREHVDATASYNPGEWEAETSAFCALGDVDGNPITAPGADPGAALYQERRRVLIGLRRHGAVRWVLPCRWSATKELRVGDEVRVRVAWMPDYRTRRRGLDAVGVIVAVRDEDLATRVLTIESIEGVTAAE